MWSMFHDGHPQPIFQVTSDTSISLYAVVIELWWQKWSRWISSSILCLLSFSSALKRIEKISNFLLFLAILDNISTLFPIFFPFLGKKKWKAQMKFFFSCSKCVSEKNKIWKFFEIFFCNFGKKKLKIFFVKCQHMAQKWNNNGTTVEQK